MHTKIGLLFGIVLTCLVFVNCRDFYIGMFKKGDILAVNDFLYKERRPHTRAVARYLKVLRCPITYIRVADRLGVGGGPNVRIVRGGLRKNHIYLYLTSSYNRPLSVAIYLGCQRAKTTTTKAIPKDVEKTTIGSSDANKTEDVTKADIETTSKKPEDNKKKEDDKKQEDDKKTDDDKKQEDDKKTDDDKKQEDDKKTDDDKKEEDDKKVDDDKKEEDDKKVDDDKKPDTTKPDTTTSAKTDASVVNRANLENNDNEVVNDEPQENNEEQNKAPNLPKRPSPQDSALNFKHMV